MVQNQEKNSIPSLLAAIGAGRRHLEATGLSPAASAFLAAALATKIDASLFVITPTQKDAETFIADMALFSHGSRPVVYFPPYNLTPFKPLAYHADTAAERIRVLYQRLTDPKPAVVVTPVEALIQRIIPKNTLVDFAELIMAGEETDRDALIHKLVAGGYRRATLVEEPGDFSVRGGILDIFSPLYPDPFRLELFGDMVESIRFFSAATQRKSSVVDEVVVLPAGETVIGINQVESVVFRVRAESAALELPVTKVRDLVDQLKKEGTFTGIESLIPLIYPEADTLLDYAPENTLFVLSDASLIESEVDAAISRARQNHDRARQERRLCMAPEKSYLSWQAARDALEKRRVLALKPIAVSSPETVAGPDRFEFAVSDNAQLALSLQERRDREHLLTPLTDWIRARKQAGQTVVITAGTAAQADRIGSLLAPYALAPQIVDHFPRLRSALPMLYICLGSVSAGFLWPEQALALVTEDEIFGAKRHRPKKPARYKPQTEILAFSELKQGDLVVHMDHGIGQYRGLVKLTLDKTTNDFILLQYKGEDRLYLPVDRMGAIQKYVGVDGIVPVLDKMGGHSWERVKLRVKRSAEKMAGELLAIYAARKVSKGYAYPAVDAYFRDFEAGFAYEETADQLKAIETVLDDMAAEAPMDRLVCGDVGYGKTEVALRASFVAVNGGRQVAVLVPTTVLAEQHFATFSQRFERYPFRVACLSRFRPVKEQRQIIEQLADGRIDIVVGTHRLLQKDVQFKDLGLVVLDEEQRFGVRHKEKLKKIRTSVDVLALTATPIPRTLHMSLLGIRDISIISTPPEQRQAIITYICDFDDAVVADAIGKEMARGGQVFFVHNNINTIEATCARLQRLVPAARLAVAHGRLDETQLEQVMMAFIRREIDMLVCTTIIESGLDIPAANTIIVNRADRFGLSQIYQLRGRVGRGDAQAYAYLLIPEESNLSKDAQKRLKVLMEYSDLGSGFQIAMSDLKIRGGGTILGSSQSGHIAAVGYEMFLQLMETAVSELQGEPVIEGLEPEINVELSAYIPEGYIPDIDQRLLTYRRLSKISEPKAIADFKAELIDRFGPLPSEVSNLLFKILLKTLAVAAGVKKLDMAADQLQLSFSPAHQKHPYGIVDLVTSDAARYSLTPDHQLRVRLNSGKPGSILVQAKKILKEISCRVNR